MPQFGFTFDKLKCAGCHSCTVACKSENNTPPGVRYRRVVYKESGTRAGAPPNELKRSVTSMACFHCANPACVTACPVGAMTKEATFGTVKVNSTLCIGCRRCAGACPYGAPEFNPATKKMEKCTACWHRLFDDSVTPPVRRTDARPACVAACPARALGFTEKTTWPATGGTAPGAFYDRTKTNPSVEFD